MVQRIPNKNERVCLGRFLASKIFLLNIATVGKRSENFFRKIQILYICCYGTLLVPPITKLMDAKINWGEISCGAVRLNVFSSMYIKLNMAIKFSMLKFLTRHRETVRC